MGTRLEAASLNFKYLNQIKELMSKLDNDSSMANKEAKKDLDNPITQQKRGFIHLVRVSKSLDGEVSDRTGFQILPSLKYASIRSVDVYVQTHTEWQKTFKLNNLERHSAVNVHKHLRRT